jgi:hypothetical protein
VANTDETKSQKTLPAPPTDIPTATPTIFPTPSVPARASRKERKEFSPLLNPESFFITLFGWRIKKALSFTKKKIPTAVTAIGRILKNFITKASAKPYAEATLFILVCV